MERRTAERRLALVFVVMLVMLLSAGTMSATASVDMDIHAEIRNIWTSDTMSPIVLFGQNANLGQVVQADLDHNSFSDSLPNYDDRCLGDKNYDKTVISRFREGDNKVRIVMDITGGTGFKPGSEGYIKITNPDYKITKIYDHSDYIGALPPTVQPPDLFFLHNDYFGFGRVIDMEEGSISWQGRGTCPACACRENYFRMEFLVEKVVSDEDPSTNGIAPAVGWAMFNHDEKNSRLSDSTMPMGVYQKWIGEFDDDFFLLKDSISPPLVIGDKVLIAVGGMPSDYWSVALSWFLNQIGIPTPPSLPPPEIQTVYCMNATNSDVIWKKTFATSAIHLAVSSNRIFVVFDGFDPIIWRSGVCCLKIEDGSVIWHNLGIKPSHGITLADNKLFVDGLGELTAPMQFEKCLYCLRGGDGAPLWEYVLGDDNYDYVEGPVAVANGKVFFTSANNRVYCLDTNTGQEIRSYQIGSKLTSPAIDDGKIYIGAKYKLYCLDQENCNEIWAYPQKSVSGTFHAPTLTAGGQLLIYYSPPLFSPEDPRVLCIDRNTGIKRWEFAVDSLSMPGKPNNKVLASVDNKALIYTNEKLLCLDIFTGKTLWEKPIEVKKSDGLCIGEWICIDGPRLADEKVFMSLMRSCLLYYEMVLLCLEPEDSPFCALNCTPVHSSKIVGVI